MNGINYIKFIVEENVRPIRLQKGQLRKIVEDDKRVI